MIPYFSWQTISLGPVTLQVWGLCVASGALTALFFCLREIHCHSERSEESLEARDKGSFTPLRSVQDDTEIESRKISLNPELMWSVFFWLMFGGFIGARIFHVLFYEWNYYTANQIEIFKFWRGGASSLGGFVGALVALYIFLKIKILTLADFKPYAQIIGVWFWLGWAIGRLGCFFIHDHVGRLTNFFLAVNFPDGARFDLGLMDSLLALIIFLILFFIRHRGADKINYPILGFSLYALVRFFLDFLRAEDIAPSDARYWHLTPAQWGIVGFFGVIVAVRIRNKKNKILP